MNTKRIRAADLKVGNIMTTNPMNPAPGSLVTILGIIYEGERLRVKSTTLTGPVVWTVWGQTFVHILVHKDQQTDWLFVPVEQGAER